MGKKVRLLTLFVIFLTLLIHTFISLQKIINAKAPDFIWLLKRTEELLLRNTHTSWNPPYALLVYIPFTFIQVAYAQAIFVFMSFSSMVGSILISIILGFKKIRLEVFLIVTSFVLFAFPTKFTFGMGQNNFIAMSFLLYSFYLR